jgi:hypothetical protein
MFGPSIRTDEQNMTNAPDIHLSWILLQRSIIHFVVMLKREDTAIEDTVIAELVETDLSRWHLDSSREGQVAWTYDTSMGREMGEQSFETKYWLSIHEQVCHFLSPRLHFKMRICSSVYFF